MDIIKPAHSPKDNDNEDKNSSDSYTTYSESEESPDAKSDVSRISQTSPPFVDHESKIKLKTNSISNETKTNGSKSFKFSYADTDSDNDNLPLNNKLDIGQVSYPSKPLPPTKSISPTFSQSSFPAKSEISKDEKIYKLGIPTSTSSTEKEFFNSHVKKITSSEDSCSESEASSTSDKSKTNKPDNESNRTSKTDLPSRQQTCRNRPKSRIGIRNKSSENESDISDSDDSKSSLEIIPLSISNESARSRPKSATRQSKACLQSSESGTAPKRDIKKSVKELDSLSKSGTPLKLISKDQIKLNDVNAKPKLSYIGNESDSENEINMCPFRGPLPGEYDPEKFKNLEVSNEIENLFINIIKYTPVHMHIDTKLKSFIPDYLAAVGDLDAFLKVISPKSPPFSAKEKLPKFIKLGLSILDEPALNQTDPAVLHLHLRAAEKNTAKSYETDILVTKITNIEKESHIIDNWIEEVTNLHKTQPAASVNYENAMPPIEMLMQSWPPNFEEMLNKNGFPSYKLECSLSEYIDLTCTMLDIPVYNNKIESLHLLFELYIAAEQSQLVINTIESVDSENFFEFADDFAIDADDTEYLEAIQALEYEISQAVDFDENTEDMPEIYERHNYLSIETSRESIL